MCGPCVQCCIIIWATVLSITFLNTCKQHHLLLKLVHFNIYKMWRVIQLTFWMEGFINQGFGFYVQMNWWKTSTPITNCFWYNVVYVVTFVQYEIYIVSLKSFCFNPIQSCHVFRPGIGFHKSKRVVIKFIFLFLIILSSLNLHSL